MQRQPRSDQPQPDDDSDDLLSLIPECKPTGEARASLHTLTQLSKPSRFKFNRFLHVHRLLACCNLCDHGFVLLFLLHEALLALDAATAAGVTAAPQRTSLPSSSSIHQPAPSHAAPACVIRIFFFWPGSVM